MLFYYFCFAQFRLCIRVAYYDDEVFLRSTLREIITARGNIKTTLLDSSTASRRHFTRVQSRIMNHLPFFIVNNYGSTLYCVYVHTLSVSEVAAAQQCYGTVELLFGYCSLYMSSAEQCRKNVSEIRENLLYSRTIC